MSIAQSVEWLTGAAIPITTTRQPKILRPHDILEKPYWTVSTEEAAYLLYVSRKARTDFRYFCQLCYDGYQFPRHLLHLRNVLEGVDRTPNARVIVTMPPRYGKSLTVSTLYPIWILGRHPEVKVVTASYTGALTTRFAREMRAIMEGPAYQLAFPGVKPSGRADAVWGIKGHRGGLMATGVTSQLTGFGADYFLLDDPIRDMMYADSESWRENLWNWYTSTAYTRLHPGARVLTISTRWHYDDLTGRLLAQNDDPDADTWEEVYFPAMFDDGTPLWPERYDAEALRRIRASVGSRTWNALYQGRPTAAAGNMFKRWMFRKIIARVPREGDIHWVRYWDKAGSEGKGDYTVGALVGCDSSDRFFLADLVRGQWTALERERTIEATAKLDRELYGQVITVVEQEPGSGGLESAQNTLRRLAAAGFGAHSDKPSGSLVLRADPLLTFMEAGNFYFKNGSWLSPMIDEFCSFPLGAHDDQVAACSGAIKMLTGGILDFRYDVI